MLRNRVWLGALAVLGLIGLVLMAGGAQPAPLVVAVLGAALVLALLTVITAAVISRRRRLAHEEQLTAWAAERAAGAERLRIARDLHDLASHGLGLITVRAAAARTVSGPAGEAERSRALADIEQAGRAATTELRRMLAVLRTPGDEAPLRPASTLADLPGIVAEAAAAGVAAEVRVDDLGPVSAGVQLTVCAVVREALANVARHAGPVPARVSVHRRDGDVVARVEDAGPAAGWRSVPGAGVGLTGLAERVAAHAGAISAGLAGGGFRVEVRLPDVSAGPAAPDTLSATDPGTAEAR